MTHTANTTTALPSVFARELTDDAGVVWVCVYQMQPDGTCKCISRCAKPVIRRVGIDALHPVADKWAEKAAALAAQGVDVADPVIAEALRPMRVMTRAAGLAAAVVEKYVEKI